MLKIILKIVLVILFIHSFAVSAANEFEVAGKDSFDIDIAKNFRSRNFISKITKGEITFNNAILTIKTKDSTLNIPINEIKRCRVGYLGYSFIKIVFKNKTKKKIFITFRYRDVYKNFITKIKENDIKLRNTFPLEISYFALCVVLIIFPYSVFN